METTQPVSYLKREDAPSLAYRKIEPQYPRLPTAVFLTGFASDMSGSKASWLDDFCQGRGQGYIRFDYRGHGLSEGDFADGTIGLWLADTLDIIDGLTSGPLILVGSSMGGWIGLLAARARAGRVKGFIGLAAAPDFTLEIESQINAAQAADLSDKGYFLLPHGYDGPPHKITQKILADGKEHCLLGAPLDLSCPVRLIQGMKDADVPWRHAGRIMDALSGPDKKDYYREDGDHRLSAPGDLALLGTLIEELSAKT